jgi:Tol biopolymer transport system component
LDPVFLRQNRAKSALHHAARRLGLATSANQFREDHSASWSHDGQRIVFTTDAGHGMEIYTFDLKTGETRQLTTDAPGLGTPFWSPDEKTIVFTFHREDQSEIFFMDADGTNQRKASF